MKEFICTALSQNRGSEMPGAPQGTENEVALALERGVALIRGF